MCICIATVNLNVITLCPLYIPKTRVQSHSIHTLTNIFEWTISIYLNTIKTFPPSVATEQKVIQFHRCLISSSQTEFSPKTRIVTRKKLMNIVLTSIFELWRESEKRVSSVVGERGTKFVRVSVLGNCSGDYFFLFGRFVSKRMVVCGWPLFCSPFPFFRWATLPERLLCTFFNKLPSLSFISKCFPFNLY